MNHPLFYPFLAILCILTLPFLVWGWYALKERRRRESLTTQEFISEALYKFLTTPRAAIQSGPMYQHKGHRHGARRRGPNRAAFRATVARLLARVPEESPIPELSPYSSRSRES
jgi:hypothetical protein